MCKYPLKDLEDSKDQKVEDDQPSFSRSALFGMIVLPFVGAVLVITLGVSLLIEPIQIEDNVCNDCRSSIATPSK